MSRRTLLLEALASMPVDLRRIVQPLDDHDVHWHPFDQGTTPHQVVIDLIADEQLFLQRIRDVLSGSIPDVWNVIQSPDEEPERSAAKSESSAREQWLAIFGRPARPRDLSRSMAQLLDEFTARRKETIDLLTELRQRDWAVPAGCEKDKVLRLRDRVQQQVEADTQALEYILMLRTAMNALRGRHA